MRLNRGRVFRICALGGDDLVALTPACKELRDQFGRMLQIAIHTDDGLAAGFTQAGHERALVAEVARETRATQGLVQLGLGDDLRPSAVRAAIIDQDDFERHADAGHDLFHGQHEGFDVALLVIHGGDDGELRAQAWIGHFAWELRRIPQGRGLCDP